MTSTGVPLIRNFVFGSTFFACCALAIARPAAATDVASRSATPAIQIIDIGGYGGGRPEPSVVTAVSNGLVVGYADLANGTPNAVSTRGAGLTNIGAGLDGTLASAVNASGTAVGQIFFPGPTQQRAAIFAGGRETALGALPGDASSIATGINATGEIVGTSTPATTSTPAPYVSQAFSFRDGKMSPIPQLRALAGFRGANALGVNDAGTIVGSVGYGAAFFSSVASYALVGTKLALFGVLHATGNSEATAVNAAGIVTGYYSTFSYSVNAPLHAYSYDTSTAAFTDLGTLYPNDSFATSVGNAIDRAGTIVGYSQPHGGSAPPAATLFAKGRIVDLNTLLPAKSGWQLEIATGIDDLGDIVGIGIHNAVERGFLLRTGARFAARAVTSSRS